MRSEFVNSSRIVCWIFLSVAKSMLDVASSRMITELCRNNARAIAISCLWPCEKFVPPADTCVSRVTVVLASTSVMMDDAEEEGKVASSW